MKILIKWTKQLIPDISNWLKYTHRQVDYYLTQALTGHGQYKTYTKKIGKGADDRCMYCGIIDTAEHTIFECNRWAHIRNETNRKLNEELRVDNITNTMSESRQNWDIIHNMIKIIMKTKEMDNRQRRQ